MLSTGKAHHLEVLTASLDFLIVSGYGHFMVVTKPHFRRTVIPSHNCESLEPTESALSRAPSLSPADATVDVILLGVQIFLEMMDFS